MQHSQHRKHGLICRVPCGDMLQEGRKRNVRVQGDMLSGELDIPELLARWPEILHRSWELDFSGSKKREQGTRLRAPVLLGQEGRCDSWLSGQHPPAAVRHWGLKVQVLGQPVLSSSEEGVIWTVHARALWVRDCVV